MKIKLDAKGYSLVECVIAILVVSMIAAGASTNLLAIQKVALVSDRKEQAAYYSRQLKETLRNYVIADQNGAGPKAEDRLALHNAMVGFLGCTVDCHKLRGDSCDWAFDAACESHDATKLLPRAFQQPPFNAQMHYKVTRGPDGPAISVDIDWQEPQS